MARVRGVHAAFAFGWIDIVGIRADVRENRLRTEGADGTPGGHKGKRRHEHFVARLNTARSQCQNQRVRSGSHADGVRDAAELGKLFLERGAFAAQHKLLRRQHALDGRANLSADGGVLRGQIKLRHGVRKGWNLRRCGHRFCGEFSIRQLGLGFGRSGTAKLS